METALEKLNPTLFNEFAGKNNEIWNEIVGTHIQHSIWGLCTIEGVDLDESVILCQWAHRGSQVFSGGYLQRLDRSGRNRCRGKGI